MNFKISFLRIALGLAALLPARVALADDAVRVGVVVEVTPEGKKISHPTLEKPAYYEPVVIGYRRLGGYLTFYQRTPPPEAEVKRALVEALASQGYKVAPANVPASLVIAFRWGYVDPEIQPVFDSKDSAIDRIEPVHESEMLAIIVGNSWDDIYPTADPNARELTSDLKDKDASRYILIISALDAKAFAQHKQVLLWRAHVSTQYWGHYLDEVLGSMITAATPFLGRETTRPQIITTDAAPISPGK